MAKKNACGRLDISLSSPEEKLGDDFDELQGKDELVRLLLNCTREAIYGIDQTGRCIICNESCWRLLGYESEHGLMGRNMHALMHHHQTDHTVYPPQKCCILETIKTGKSRHVEDDIFWRADGSSFQVEYWAHPLRRNGKVIGAVVSFVDISRRKVDESALRRSEAGYHKLFSEMVSGCSLYEVQYDQDGQPADYLYLDVNPSFEEITGFKREDVIGRSFLEVMPDAEQYWLETFAKVALSGEPARIENYAGSLFKFLDVTAFCPKKGKFAITFTDVTDRKLMEDDLQQTSEQLSVLLESLPIVPLTCSVSEEQKITFMGSGIEEITGYKPEEFVDDQSFWLDKIHKDDLKTVLTSCEEILEKGRQRLDFRLQAADGSYKWFGCTRRLVRFEDGTNSHIVGVWQDITQEKKIKLESEARLQQVIQADKLASLGEVVAGVAHEINNPNSFIGYNLPLMGETWEVFEPILKEFGAANPHWRHDGLSMAELCGDMVEIIKAIRAGSERINKVVANLKDFARLDESTRTTDVMVNEVVDKAYEIVGAQARKYIGTINIELADDLPVIKGHFQKLEQVVANLIVNAAYAVPERESGRLALSTRYVERLGSVLIEIEDNGSGMTSEVKDKIFEPFFTTRRDSGGTGLGLAVSYGLVKEHQGKISVFSRPGLGTKFTIFLPEDRRGGMLNLQPTMLCVDDDPEMLNLMHSYFVKVQEMPLETVDRPERVIGFLEAHPEIDMILSDIRMPRVSGWQLLSLIKERFPLLPVLLMTGYDVDAVDRPSHLQPDYFFQKPFNFDELNSVIKKIGRLRI